MRQDKVLSEQGHVTIIAINSASIIKLVKKVTEDIESLNFNTAISAMMILVNELYRKNKSEITKVLKAIISTIDAVCSTCRRRSMVYGLGGEGFCVS